MWTAYESLYPLGVCAQDGINCIPLPAFLLSMSPSYPGFEESFPFNSAADIKCVPLPKVTAYSLQHIFTLFGDCSFNWRSLIVTRLLFFESKSKLMGRKNGTFLTNFVTVLDLIPGQCVPWLVNLWQLDTVLFSSHCFTQSKKILSFVRMIGIFVQ